MSQAGFESGDEWDVVIVGGGPVGALGANMLACTGLRVLVLERQLKPYPLPRAVHLDHEMMRLFNAAGLLGELEPLMVGTDGHVHIGADGGVIRYLGSVGKPKPFYFSNDYFFYQPELEEVLRAGLDRFENAALHLGASVTGVRQIASDVELDVSYGDDVRTIRSQFVIACDGARSTVRKQLGVKLDDLGFEEPWLVVDAEVDGPISFPKFGLVPPQADLQRLSVMLCDPKRPTTIVPGRGNHRRWEFMLLPGEIDEDMMRRERVTELVSPWVQGSEHQIVRASTYRFHALVAERWQVGRVFLAGDAAHQTPPFFGQGMCHGFRDVANLAWKLKLVLEGVSGADLLSTYQPEREPHVRSVIGAAVDAGKYICELDPVAATERDRLLREAGRAEQPRTAADLIPAIQDGVVYSLSTQRSGVGSRFIQPKVARHGGPALKLDELTGGGWVMISADSEASALDMATQEVWSQLEGRTIVIGEDLEDSEGFLTMWLRNHHASVVVVRPDFYTYAIARDATDLREVIDNLASDLALVAQPTGAYV